MATPSFLQASLSTGRCCDFRPLRGTRPQNRALAGSHISGPGRGAITLPPLLGLGSISRGQQATLPMLPQRIARESWFPLRLGLRRWRRVVPQPARCRKAEIKNEGAPFRCLGLHTHRKAPAEAQARFSEDPAKQFYRIRIKAAQPDTTGRPNMTRRTLLI